MMEEWYLVPILVCSFLGQIRSAEPISLNEQTDLLTEIDIAERSNSSSVHLRRRRYVVFPEGSTFTTVFTIKKFITKSSIFTEGVNWAMSYDLPDKTTISKLSKKSTIPKKRYKRDLYKRVEILMNSFYSFSVRTIVSPVILMAFCTSVKALTGADAIFTEGVNWALSYDLPNETFSELKRKAAAPLPMKRYKRDLYEKVEILMNSAGFDGRSCVLRTICETAQLIPPRQGVIQEIIRLLFTYPVMNDATELRAGRHRDYGQAHSDGISDQDCENHFPCPLSLLQLLLQFGSKTALT